MPRKPNRYTGLIEHIFLQRYTAGDAEVPFERTDIAPAAAELDMKLPSNLGARGQRVDHHGARQGALRVPALQPVPGATEPVSAGRQDS